MSCTEKCMEQCPVARRLSQAGMDLLGAQAVIAAVGESLNVPGSCRTDGPEDSSREPGVSVCGLYYTPELAAGVTAVAALVEQGLLQPHEGLAATPLVSP